MAAGKNDNNNKYLTFNTNFDIQRSVQMTWARHWNMDFKEKQTRNHYGTMWFFMERKKIAFWFVNISKERYRVIWKQKWNLEDLHETHHYTWANNYQGATFFLPWFLKNDLIDYAYSFMSSLMNTISTDNIVTENQKVYMKPTTFWGSKKVFLTAVLPLILF